MILALSDFLLATVKNHETDPNHKAAYSLAHTTVAGAILFCAAAHFTQVALETTDLINEATDSLNKNGKVRDMTNRQQPA